MANFNRSLYGQYTENGEKPQTPPLPLVLSIGNFVAEQNEPSEGLASRAIQRLKTLRQTKPAVAAVLAGFMQRWKGRIIFIERLRQIKAGEADLETILTAVAQRKEIREKIENEVFAMRTASGIGRGIAPCLSEDNLDFLSVLRQKDADAQIAMFGCARLLRVKLPVAEVGAFLKNANKNLALAADLVAKAVLERAASGRSRHFRRTSCICSRCQKRQLQRCAPADFSKRDGTRFFRRQFFRYG